MTTDFRALCAELLDELEYQTDWSIAEELKSRARAALADEPAVPKGREPVAVTRQPSDEDLWNTANLVFQANSWPKDAIRYARAVLARWGNLKGSLDSSAPQPPAEGEVEELVAKLRKLCSDLDYDDCGEEAGYCYRAADLLQRLSLPQPVPVSERLPGPEDCDAEGGCWWLVTGCNAWSFGKYLASAVTHWLPAHALPVPEVSNG